MIIFVTILVHLFFKTLEFIKVFWMKFVVEYLANLDLEKAEIFTGNQEFDRKYLTSQFFLSIWF